MTTDTGPRLQMTEAQFQEAVEGLARYSGWLVYHTRNSRGSVAGFPDLVLVRRPRVIFAELKVGRNRPSKAQQQWLDELAACDGIEAYLWRPEHLDTIRTTLARDWRDRLPAATP